MSVDDILLKIAAIKYKELEIERMINPKKVEEYYPEDQFEGLTDEQIQAILEEEEKFYESLIKENEEEREESKRPLFVFRCRLKGK